MTHLYRFIVAAATWSLAASPAHAQDANVKSPVTVNTPVEVPGAVLEPGEYGFARVSADGDRVLIRVYEQRDGARVIATMLGVPVEQPSASAGALIPFAAAARDAGPAAVQYWVDAQGPRTYELVYSKERAAAIAQATGARVLSADAADAGALASATVTAVVDPSGSDSDAGAGVAPTARRGTTPPPPPNVAAPVGGETNPTGTRPPTGTPTSRTATEPRPEGSQAPRTPSAGSAGSASAAPASSNPTTGEPAPTPAATDPGTPATPSQTPDVPNTTAHAGYPNSTQPIRRDEPGAPAADATTGYQRDQNLPATASTATPPQTARQRRPVAPDPAAAPRAPGVARADGSDMPTRTPLPDPAQGEAEALPQTAAFDGWLLLAGGMCLVLALLIRYRAVAASRRS